MFRLSFFALLFPLVAGAQTVPATSALSSGTTFAAAASAANVSTAQAVIANAQNSSRFTFGVASDGGVTTNTAAKFSGAGGVATDVQVAGKISKLGVAAAIGKIAMGASAAYSVWQVGSGIYDLAAEFGWVQKTGGGVTQSTGNVCTDAPCYSVTFPNMNPPAVGTGTSYGAACVSLEAAIRARGLARYAQQAYTSYCLVEGYGYYEIGTSTKVGPPTADLTEKQLVDAVAARGGWLPGSPLARTLADGINKNGVQVQSVPTTVTGPATTPGTTSTKTDSTAKTTTTTTTVNNYIYEGPNVTTGATTTTTTTNNIDNSVVNQTVETVQKPTVPDAAADPVATDSLMPDQPVLYVRKYPDGIKGVWDAKIIAIKATPLFSLGSQLMPNFGSTGSCPSWQLPMNLAVWSNFGVLDVAPPCFVWDFGKVVIIVSSLLLARRLIFGG